MDRDVAISMNVALTNIKNILSTLATNTTPTEADNRSVPADAQRSAPESEDIPEQDPEPEPNKK